MKELSGTEQKCNGRCGERDFSRERGFSLVEMLIVVGLIGLLMLAALPKVSSYFRLSLNSAAREMASIVKEAYNATAITGKVHRLVYDLGSNTYWVESGPPTVLLDTAATREQNERRKRFSRNKDEEKSTAEDFRIDQGVTRKKMALPRGVVFEDVVTEQYNEPLTKGTAYTHFFPHGITEQTTIHLMDSTQHHVSLIISPLVGRTTVIDRYIAKNERLEETQ
jgi:general secretion pathway protein H